MPDKNSKYFTAKNSVAIGQYESCDFAMSTISLIKGNNLVDAGHHHSCQDQQT